MSPVQTGIWYAPDIRWAPFDAVIATPGDPDSAEFADAAELAGAVEAAGGLTPPVLARGKQADVAAVPLRFQTRVPECLGLPALQGNLAEGIVIKPAESTPASGRAVAKLKIQEFDEQRFDESEAWDPGRAIPIEGLLSLAERMVNVPRLQSAQSKVGRSRAAVRDEVVLDVLIDLGEAFPAAMGRLVAEDEERLRAALFERVSALAEE